MNVLYRNKKTTRTESFTCESSPSFKSNSKGSGRMHLDEFMDRNDGSPITLSEAAREAAKVSNCCQLAEAAREYLSAAGKLEAALDEVGFTFG